MSDKLKPDWYNRLEKEHVELSSKIVSLRNFSNSEEFNKLDSTTQTLMINQLLIMKQYSVILEERVYLAK